MGTAHCTVRQAHLTRVTLRASRATNIMTFFSLSGGFMKLNLFFPPILALTWYLVKLWVTAPAVGAALESLPFPVAKVPYVVAAAMAPLIFFSGVVPIMGLAAVVPGGYDNVNPRLMKAAGGALGQHPVLFRLQSAHLNTAEMAAMAAPAFWVASTLGLESLLFAKLSSLLLLARLLYFPFYAAGLDAVRTFLFAVGFFAISLIGFAPIFPETILPALGQALAKK